MYRWIWQQLPGPLALRLAAAVLLLLAAVAVLFFVVFPRVDPLLPWNHVTVDQPVPPGAARAAGTLVR